MKNKTIYFILKWPPRYPSFRVQPRGRHRRLDPPRIFGRKRLSTQPAAPSHQQGRANGALRNLQEGASFVRR